MSIQVSNLAQSELLQDLTAVESNAIVGGYAYSYGSTTIAAIADPLYPSICFGYSIGSVSESAPIFSISPISFGFTTEPVNLAVNLGTSDVTAATGNTFRIVSGVC